MIADEEDGTNKVPSTMDPGQASEKEEELRSLLKQWNQDILVPLLICK